MLRVSAPLRRAYATPSPAVLSFRCISGEPSSKRFLRTVPVTTTPKTSDFTSFHSPHPLSHSQTQVPSQSSSSGLSDGTSAGASGSGSQLRSKWAAHGLSTPLEQAPAKKVDTDSFIEISQPKRRSRAERFKRDASAAKSASDSDSAVNTTATSPSTSTTITNVETASTPAVSTSAAPTTASTATSVAPKKKRALRPRKALITLTSSAVDHLRALLDQPEPKHIRIGVKNRGCSGLTYHLEYVTEGGKFDELIEQDGVKVLIDSKALFSIVGSQMDWLDDKLSSRFIFRNPNSKGTCGCGESFMV